MIPFQSNNKRKIELLGLALHNTDRLRDADFADLFGRDVPTIKRDMAELRNEGIDIHSRKNSGITIGGAVDVAHIRSAIAQYIGMSTAHTAADKATALLVKKHHEYALTMVVQLQRCIDNSLAARIDYEKEAGEVERDREIHPLLLFSSEGYWRVLAENDGRVKQYHLTKITGLTPTNRTFKRISPEEIEQVFRYSFRSWTGTEAHRVSIVLNRAWAERFRHQQLSGTQEMEELSDGRLRVALTVNSLDEFASWIVARGKGVVVESPKELRARVLALARGTLENYKER
jgi:predicted DNA-binding transcriptional regulator YafY